MEQLLAFEIFEKAYEHIDVLRCLSFLGFDTISVSIKILVSQFYICRRAPYCVVFTFSTLKGHSFVFEGLMDLPTPLV